VLRVLAIRAEDPQAADEHRHLGRGQRQQLAPGRPAALGPALVVPAREVVAEAVRGRLERGEGLRVGHFLRRVGAAGREGHGHVVAGLLRGGLDRGAAAQDDQVGQRDLLAAGLRVVEFALDGLELAQDLGELGRLVDFPVLLRGEADAGAVGAAALVGAAEGGRRRPGGRTSCGMERPESRISCLRWAMSRSSISS
jgi:hypothetical protein